MKNLISIFYNSNDKRIRAGYRIIILIFVYEYLRGVVQFHMNSSASLMEIAGFGVMRIITITVSMLVVGKLLDKRSFVNFGLHLNSRWWKDFLFGFGLGALLLTIIFVTEFSLGWIKITDVYYSGAPDKSFVPSILVLLFVFFCVAINEELFYRGYLMKNMAEGFNYKKSGPKNAIFIAVVISSLIFGAFHLGNENSNLISTLNIVLGGIFLGLGYYLTGELSMPIGLHFSWNFFQGNVFGFPVSGNTDPLNIASIFRIEQSGPDLITGGAFGPEGGILGLLSFLIGTAAIVLWVRLTRGKENLRVHTELAEHIE